MLIALAVLPKGSNTSLIKFLDPTGNFQGIQEQSKSSEMQGRMKHNLESRLPGAISITLDMHMTPPLWPKAKRN